MNVGKVVLIVSVLGSVVTFCPCQGQETKPKKRARKVPAQFQPPEIQPGLPNVLLIGDSISIGYMLAARKELSGQANVFRPPTNCGPTTRGLAGLEGWLGDRKWDVIHFNFGLHDLKYLGANGENLADPQADSSHQQVPIQEYAANLKRIAERLKKTGATVIWCETTPVPQGAKGRVVGDSKRYNEAAAAAMAEVGGIEIDPLYDFAIQHGSLQKKADVHYSSEGSAKLAQQVASSIRAALNSR
jgi:acyl-CoA thioesterase-1